MAKQSDDKATASSTFVCLTLRAPDSESCDRVTAEAFEAGAAGTEERDDPEGKRILLYVSAERLHAVRQALLSVPGLEPLGEAPVPNENWSEAWKEGLTCLDISPRLRVRPSFVAVEPLAPGQGELVIDPAQAFGTGAHESTRLALECLDALAPLAAGTRVLDVGAGTGVLALAALRLGARSAVAFDIVVRACQQSVHRSGRPPPNVRRPRDRAAAMGSLVVGVHPSAGSRIARWASRGVQSKPCEWS